MEDTCPALTRAQVEKMFSDESRYYRAVDINNDPYGVYDIYKTDNRICGRVEGQHKNFYRVSVTFKKDPKDKDDLIEDWNCSCPDWGDPCKHIGALLLRWASSSSSFKERPSLESLLKRKKKDELIDIIKTVASDQEVEKRIYAILLGEEYIEDDSSSNEDERWWY